MIDGGMPTAAIFARELTSLRMGSPRMWNHKVHTGQPGVIEALEVEYHSAGRTNGDAPVGKLLLVVPWFAVPGA